MSGNRYMTEAYSKLSGDVMNTFQSVRLFGLEGLRFPPEGAKEYQFTTQLWGFYKNDGYLSTSFYTQLTPDEYDIYNQYNTSMRNNFISEVPKLIKGERSMSEWESWYESMKSSCKVDLVTTMLQSFNQKLSAE